MGKGRCVGVAGRDEGVGKELPVAVVLRLAPERRETGLLVVGGFAVLRASAAMPLIFAFLGPP